MALSLLEASKTYTGDPHRQGIIETLTESSLLLQELPFETIDGTAIAYTQEETKPSTAFRGVNEDWTDDEGTLADKKEALKICGGTMSVDKFIVSQAQGATARAAREMLKAKALGLNFVKAVIKGDETSNKNEFDGLQVRLGTGSQTIDNGTGALSLLNLDKLIGKCKGTTHLLMNLTMIQRLSQAARNSDVGGAVQYTTDSFGKRVTSFNGVPIVEIDVDGAGNEILGFSEASSTTSIYAINATLGMFNGIQGGDPEVLDLGLNDAGTKYRSIMEWYASIVMYSKQSGSRLYGITDAAVVV